MSVLDRLSTLRQALRLPADRRRSSAQATEPDAPAVIAGRIAPAGLLTPAVPIEDSVHHDYIICLETGLKLPLLRRHIQQRLGLSVEDYRRKWHLPADYPLVAPAYAEARTAATKADTGKD